MKNQQKATSFLFWQKWLFYSSLLFAFSGIMLAFFSDTILFLPYEGILAKVFWNTARFPVEVEQFRTFIFAPFGGTIACTYILLAYIAYYPFKQRQKWARNAIITAFGFWFIIDSAACFYFGVYFQFYIINVFSILVKALPLIFTWKYFEQQE